MYTTAGVWTVSPTAEHHAGMRIAGNLDHTPISGETATTIFEWFLSQGYEARNFNLAELSGVDHCGGVLHIKNGAAAFCDVDQMWSTFESLPMDSQYLDTRTGKVKNKHKRSNVNAGEEAEEANINEGIGTTVAFSSTPELKKVIQGLKQFGPDFQTLLAEGNYYHTPTKCGIGFHGDTERRWAMGVTMGKSRIIEFQAFVRSFPEGPPIRLTLDHGDIYLMYENGCGWDWKRTPKIGELPSGCPRRQYHAPHFRHRAGDEGFLRANDKENERKWNKRRAKATKKRSHPDAPEASPSKRLKK